MSDGHWFCVMCPADSPWVGDEDHDPDTMGYECPECGSGVGLFEVTETFPAAGTLLRAVIEAKIRLGHVDGV